MTKTEELKNELSKRGLKYVGTRGDVRRPLCFVGEAPGADEDQAGQPFVGAAGRELDRLIREAGIDFSDCWWTNPYKTRPPENQLGRLGELGIPTQLYIDQFFEELNNARPTFICTLGATPTGILCPQTLSRGKKDAHSQITKWRGSLLSSPLLKWPHYVLPAFHPAYILRDWSERPILLLCLAKLQEEFVYWKSNNALQPLPQRRLIVDASPYDNIDWLRAALAQDKPIAFDIENIGLYKGKHKTAQRKRIPYVVGFSYNSKEAICIDLDQQDPDKTADVWTSINHVLRNKKLVTQNGFSHDIPWMQFMGFSVNVGDFEDTMVLHHALWPECPHKLEFLSFCYTREPFYKNEGQVSPIRDRQRFRRYNALDAAVTIEVYHAEKKELEEREREFRQCP